MDIDGSLRNDLKFLKGQVPNKVSPIKLSKLFIEDCLQAINQGIDLGAEPSKPLKAMLTVKKIPDPVFRSLNNKIVYLHKGDLSRRKRTMAGEFERDSQGNLQMETVKIPSKCLAVFVHKEDLPEVPYDHESGVKGLEYIETVKLEVDKYKGEEVFRLVTIPQRYLYRMNYKSLMVGSSKTSTSVHQVKLNSPFFASSSSSYGTPSSHFYITISDKLVLNDQNTTRETLSVSSDIEELKKVLTLFMQWLTEAKLWTNIEFYNSEGSLTYDLVTEFDDEDLKPAVEEFPMMLPSEYTSAELKGDKGTPKEKSIRDEYFSEEVSSETQTIRDRYDSLEKSQDLDYQYRQEHPEEFEGEDVEDFEPSSVDSAYEEPDPQEIRESIRSSYGLSGGNSSSSYDDNSNEGTRNKNRDDNPAPLPNSSAIDEIMDI